MGLKSTRKLKEQPATADIPVIAVTSYAMKGDREKALAAGCAGYVTKPIDKNIFIQEDSRSAGWTKSKIEDSRRIEDGGWIEIDLRFLQLVDQLVMTMAANCDCTNVECDHNEIRRNATTEDSTSPLPSRGSGGESLTVTVRNRPVAKVIPIRPQGKEAEEAMHSLAEKGLLRLSKRKPSPVKRALKIRNVGIAEAVLRIAVRTLTPVRLRMFRCRSKLPSQ